MQNGCSAHGWKSDCQEKADLLQLPDKSLGLGPQL